MHGKMRLRGMRSARKFTPFHDYLDAAVTAGYAGGRPGLKDGVVDPVEMSAWRAVHLPESWSWI
jgi:hypothetical protein